MGDISRAMGLIKAVNDAGGVLSVNHLIAAFEDVRAEEREACAKLLANECMALIDKGEHEEAQVLAREAQRIRGLYPHG